MNEGREAGAPVYVKIDEYDQVLDVLESVKKSIAEARRTLEELNQLREEENAEFQKWLNSLDDIEDRVDEMDKMVFEPESNW